MSNPNPELTYYMHRHILPAAFHFLPGKMQSQNAHAEILAAGLQESEFNARVQGGGGPAHGLFQFEKNGGVAEVLDAPDTAAMLAPILKIMCYKPNRDEIYQAIVHNDVLAVILARCILWHVPGMLAGPTQPDKGYQQYLRAWRPGKPGPDRWPANFAEAWRLTLLDQLP